jgi:hypothetical protein
MARLGLGAHERRHILKREPMIAEHVEKRLREDPTPYDPIVMETSTGMSMSVVLSVVMC